jgi:hypothetical protein
LFRSTNTDADMKVVEGTGAALESGRKDLSDLEARMEAMGLAPFMERSANSTATGKMIDHTNSQCDLQAWIRSEERGLRQGFELAAEYKNAKLVEKFRVDIHNDFGMADRAAQEMDVLVKMNAMDAFSDQSLFEEAQRRGYVIEGRTWKQEQFRIEVQGPPMPRGAPTPPDGSAPIDQAQDADEDGDGDDERRAA